MWRLDKKRRSWERRFCVWESAIPAARPTMAAVTEIAILAHVAAAWAAWAWARLMSPATASGVTVPAGTRTTATSAATGWSAGLIAGARARSAVPAVTTARSAVAVTRPGSIPARTAITRSWSAVAWATAIAVVVTRRWRVITWRYIHITPVGAITAVIDVGAAVPASVNRLGINRLSIDRLRIHLFLVVAGICVTTCKRGSHEKSKQDSSIHGGLPDRGRARTSDAGRHPPSSRQTSK